VEKNSLKGDYIIMANLDFFGLFDFSAGDGALYQYTASEFNEILKSITSNGVMKDKDNELAVSVNGLAVEVASGVAFINGRIAVVKTTKSLTLDASSTNRMDRIVIRADLQNRTITLEVLKGSSATAPALTQTENIYEITLAKILVPANSTATVLTDERVFTYTPTQAVDKMNAITSGTDFVYAVYA